MQERWFVALGFVPMLIGAVALVLLRRPSETPVQAIGNDAPRIAERTPDGLGVARVEPDGYLGVIVAGHTADLGAEIGGSVVRVFVREGARVKADESLVYIDPSAANSEAQMAEAELAQQASVVIRAQAEHAEASDLLARLIASGSGIPEHTLVAARSREASARAALDAARAGIDVGKARIHREQARMRKHLISAPFAGTVVMLGVDPGDIVRAGQAVARVISDDQAVRFAVPPDSQALTKVGAAVRVRVPNTDLVASGVVTEVLPEVDAASGLVFVRARLLADETAAPVLVAGSSVRVVAAAPASQVP